ncbi:MAG: TerC family protein [Thiobacillaceae bacterium]
MELDPTFHAIGLIFQVFVLDLILSGDNAVVIALAFRSLPPHQQKQAMLIGTGAAVGMRVVLTTLVGLLMLIPLLKVIGGVWLIVIAIRLLIAEEQDAQPVGEAIPPRLWSAVMTVLAADLVMSLDNVVALAAVSQGSTFYLVLGLLLSIPLLMFGSTLMAQLLNRYPIFIPAGGALLGYIAGDIAMSDPILSDTVHTQSPALTVLVPWLCAVFVVVQSRIIEARRAQVPRPVRLTIRPEAIPPKPITKRSAPPGIPSIVPSSSAAKLSNEALTLTNSEHGSSIDSSDRQTSFLGIPPPILGFAGGTIVVAIILTAAWTSLSRIPDKKAANDHARQDTAYVCPGGVATIFYRPYGSSILMVAPSGEMNGYVDSRNKITWSNLQQFISILHFTPPDKIENYANKVILYGGSFSHVECVVQR